MNEIEISTGELIEMLLVLARIPKEVYYKDPEAYASIQSIVCMVLNLRETDWTIRAEDRKRLFDEALRCAREVRG